MCGQKSDNLKEEGRSKNYEETETLILYRTCGGSYNDVFGNNTNGNESR